jgi:hypothetical protein
LELAEHVKTSHKGEVAVAGGQSAPLVAVPNVPSASPLSSSGGKPAPLPAVPSGPRVAGLGVQSTPSVEPKLGQSTKLPEPANRMKVDRFNF